MNIATGNHSRQAERSRSGESRNGFVWLMPLRDQLSVIGVPLRGNHPDAPLDLQQILNQVYTRGGYDLDINYQIEPADPLSPADMDWARQAIAKS